MFYNSLKDTKAPKEPKGRSSQLKTNPYEVPSIRTIRMLCHSLEDIKAPKEPKDWPLQLIPNLLQFQYKDNQDALSYYKG